MVILLLQMHRNFQRVEEYNMFSLLLLTPKYRPLCLYTLHLAYLCLAMHNVLPRQEEAEIMDRAERASKAEWSAFATCGTLGTISSAGVKSREPN